MPPRDSWLRLPPNEFVISARELDRAEFAVVPAAAEAGALARLSDTASVELSTREARELVGEPLAGVGSRLVLLRGVSWDTSHGSFTVCWRSGAVRVVHGCLGQRSLPVVRRAIVARLPDLPAQVYVDLVMAR